MRMLVTYMVEKDQTCLKIQFQSGSDWVAENRLHWLKKLEQEWKAKLEIASSSSFILCEWPFLLVCCLRMWRCWFTPASKNFCIGLKVYIFSTNFYWPNNKHFVYRCFFFLKRSFTLEDLVTSCCKFHNAGHGCTSWWHF